MFKPSIPHSIFLKYCIFPVSSHCSKSFFRFAYSENTRKYLLSVYEVYGKFRAVCSRQNCLRIRGKDICVHGEDAKIHKKRISWDILVQHENFVRSFISMEDGLDEAKKQFHATLPLKCQTWEESFVHFYLATGPLVWFACILAHSVKCSAKQLSCTVQYV